MATFRVGLMANMATSACPVQRERRLRERRTRLVPPRASTSSNNNGPMNKSAVDRRDVLLGLGGAAAMAATAMTPGGVILPVMAAPLAPPDLSKCHTSSSHIEGFQNCCPPYSAADIIDYDFPRTHLRVRRPAHEVKNDEEYMAKYKEAIKKMKELKSDHPWNFYQQALIHCAYCNDAYDQVGYSGVTLQVHHSWFFLPWHRYYLHFYERILGKLIDDDTFTLPFWNFDVEEGMTVPEIFTSDQNSPLYNELRDTTHYHPAILDYRYAYKNTAGSGKTGQELVQANMSYMQTTFKNSLQLPELFMGDPLRAGDPEVSSKGNGGLEVIHNSVHQWVGTAESPHRDMGDFSTAGRDCVFYSLHANVDRLWHLFRNFRGNRIDFNDTDWLDSTFIFFDEHERVVRVKVRDCLNPTKLRYTYEDVPIPWMGSLKVQKAKETKSKQDINLVPVGEFGNKARELGKTPLRVLVSRPKANRKKNEKEEKVEVLQIKDIVVSSQGPARFDVFVAAPYGELAGPDFGEFLGSFVKLPHKMQTEHKPEQGPKRKGRITNLKLGLTAFLEDIDVDHAEKLVVTIVPAGGDITIGDVKIKLVQTDTHKVVVG